MANQRKCPICGKFEVDRYRPFCSKRCADVDLGRWLDGRYFIPTEEGPAAGPESEPED
jgi:uncharacterized protein